MEGLEIAFKISALPSRTVFDVWLLYLRLDLDRLIVPVFCSVRTLRARTRHPSFSTPVHRLRASACWRVCEAALPPAAGALPTTATAIPATTATAAERLLWPLNFSLSDDSLP